MLTIDINPRDISRFIPSHPHMVYYEVLLQGDTTNKTRPKYITCQNSCLDCIQLDDFYTLQKVAHLERLIDPCIPVGSEVTEDGIMIQLNYGVVIEIVPLGIP